MKKNDIINLKIERVAENGDGIAYAPDGRIVFCQGALADETVNCLIIKETERYYVGKILEIEPSTESPYRKTPECEVYKHCGGCVLAHVNYRGQLSIKENHVHESIRRIGGIGDYEAEPILASPMTEYYRNKSIYQFAPAKDGKTALSGFYRRNSHDIIDCTCCKISDKRAENVRAAFSEIALKYRLAAYSETTGKGLIRRIMVRTSLSSDAAMLVIVINGKTLPKCEELLRELLSKCPFIKSVYINVNTSRGNTALGDEFVLIYGDEYLEDTIGEARFKISPQSFFQVNPLQTVRLYEKAFEYADLQSGDYLLDLFCGIGTIGIFFANKAKERGFEIKKLLGIEYTPKAVKDAELNAEINGLSDIAGFKAGDAEKVLSQISTQLATEKPDVIVVDPPRKGLAPFVIEAVCACNPRIVVYVSCNPATLARDLKRFDELGYKTKKVCPVDMFPHTEHVETVVCLNKESSAD